MIRIFIIALTLLLLLISYEVVRDFNSSPKGRDGVLGYIVGYSGKKSHKPVKINSKKSHINKDKARLGRAPR